MSKDFLSLKIENIEKVTAALNRFSGEIHSNMQQAGKEAADEILNTEGLREYPPETAANRPPTPYYIRGRGTQTKRGNLGNSERYGTQFYVKPFGSMATKIGNRASYAKFLGGTRQARAMAAKGWKKLFDVATDKLPEITRIFQKRINYLIRKLGL